MCCWWWWCFPIDGCSSRSLEKELCPLHPFLLDRKRERRKPPDHCKRDKNIRQNDNKSEGSNSKVIISIYLVSHRIFSVKRRKHFRFFISSRSLVIYFPFDYNVVGWLAGCLVLAWCGAECSRSVGIKTMKTWDTRKQKNVKN